MEKKIINEINRSLNIMGLYDNLILENVTSETLKSIGKIALRVFKNNISKGSNDSNMLKSLYRNKMRKKFLDDNDKFWKYVSQGQDIGRFTFDNDNDVYELISEILEIDAGYFSTIFRNVLKKDGNIIDFDKFIRDANSTNFEDAYDAYFFLVKNVNDTGGIDVAMLTNYFFNYAKKYKESEVFVNDLPKFSNKLSIFLNKYKLSKNWGITYEAIILASKTNQDRLITNIKITINNASKELTNSSTSGGSNDEKIYNDLYKKIETYFQAFYMKENDNYKDLLESFRNNAPDDVKKLIDNIINTISTPTPHDGVKKIYTIIDALAPDENRSAWRNLKLKFGYGIAESIDDLPKKPISEDVTDVVGEIKKKSGTFTLFKKAIIKASTSAPVKTMAQSYAFGVLPNRKLIVKYLSDAKIFSDNKLAGPAASKYIRYLRAYFTIQIYSLVRKVIIYGLIPVFTGVVKAIYETDGSIRTRNLLNRNYNLVMGRNYTEIEYTNKNLFIDLIPYYVAKDFKYLFQWIVSSNFNSFGSFVSPIIKNIVLPAYILSLTEAFIWKKVLYPIVTDLNINKGFESFDYSEFIDNLFNNEMRRNQEELDNNNPQIQAGGTEVTINTPTWSYNTEVTFPNFKFIDINFRGDKTRKVMINNTDTRFSIIGNKVRISVPSSTTINSIKIIDDRNVTHTIRQQQ